MISTFDLFSIGVGPSSSHTVGPMRCVPVLGFRAFPSVLTPRAARIFLHSLPHSLYSHIHSLKISLHGSLAATGMGHMTPHATFLGLMGEDPETVPVGRLEKVMDEVKEAGSFELGLPEGYDGVRVKFDLGRDLVRPPTGPADSSPGIYHPFLLTRTDSASLSSTPKVTFSRQTNTSAWGAASSSIRLLRSPRTCIIWAWTSKMSRSVGERWRERITILRRAA